MTPPPNTLLSRLGFQPVNVEGGGGGHKHSDHSRKLYKFLTDNMKLKEEVLIIVTTLRNKVTLSLEYIKLTGDHSYSWAVKVHEPIIIPPLAFFELHQSESDF